MMQLPYEFKNALLLQTALTHPSAVKDKSKNYERMEFLGDSILQAVIADVVYCKFPQYTEGMLSVMVANLVNSNALAMIAKKINLESAMIFDYGEEMSGGRDNPHNLENSLEALIAAIYLDSDFDTVRKIVIYLWDDFFFDEKILLKKDYKTQLQEMVQKKYGFLPKYQVETVDGVSHKPMFTISVEIHNICKTYGHGSSKKSAEQNAAQQMLLQIQSLDE